MRNAARSRRPRRPSRSSASRRSARRLASGRAASTPGQANLASAISAAPRTAGAVRPRACRARRDARERAGSARSDPQGLMPDPAVLQDMEKAAERLADAIIAGEQVAIFGDYDVDGACSSALMRRFFEAHGLEARIYIPDRIFEGYGPNTEAIETLVKEGARLIVTVDCGTVSLEVAGRRGQARRRGGRRRPPPGRRAAAARDGDRQSEPAGRRLGPGPSCARRASSISCWWQRPGRCAGAASTSRTAPPSRRSSNGSISWRSPPSAMSCRSRASTAPMSSRACRSCASGATSGLRALADAAGLNQPPTPYHLGYRAGSAHQCRRAHRQCGARRRAALDRRRGRGRAHRRAARQAQQRTQGDGDGDPRAGAGRRRGRDRRQSGLADPDRGLEGLAQGPRRAGRQPADRPLPAAGLRHRLGAGRAGHGIAALDRRRRYRRGGARGAWRTACSSRAAGTPWRRA